MNVSVVIPTYNRAHLIERTVASVLAQETAPTEIIVVDDGSTDDTARVLAAMGSAVTAISKVNEGGAAARNAGVAAANTDWIAFLDSDDLWLPDHLTRLLAARDKTNERADLYFDDTRQAAADAAGTIFEAAGLDLGDSPWLLRTDAKGWAVATRQPAMLQSCMVRRSAFVEVGELWPALSSRHDTHFFYRILADRPACAVAGVGTEMTADDDVGNRLTPRSQLSGRRYWDCTVLLYQDLLERRTDQRERTILRDLLARGHKRLARINGAQRQPVGALRNLATGMATSPLSIPWSIARPGSSIPAVVTARAEIEAASAATEEFG
jgi:glycosyltransferase involved in cell wall biosynthesis